MSPHDSGYERIDGDRYFTPHWVTQALLAVEHFPGGIWDPCAGAGHILQALPHGVPGFGSDIDPVGDSIKTADFFDTVAGSSWPNIVTNPPYGQGGKMAVRFIEHALDLTRPHGGKVAMLLRVDFDSASTRRHIFDDHPAFAAKYVLTRRVGWANLPQTSSPTINHAWLIWDWRKRAGTLPSIGYLPRPKENSNAA